ncbi:hypothetical protein EDD15DRAFT_2191429 [Pisolithus albus]|nr:hypothetical protein EDD15DRAFT_2191429 [Pisolithus albus]
MPGGRIVEVSQNLNPGENLEAGECKDSIRSRPPLNHGQELQTFGNIHYDPLHVSWNCSHGIDIAIGRVREASQLAVGEIDTGKRGSVCEVPVEDSPRERDSIWRMFIDIDFDPADAEKSTYTEADGAEEKEAMEADTREVIRNAPARSDRGQLGVDKFIENKITATDLSQAKDDSSRACQPCGGPNACPVSTHPKRGRGMPKGRAQRGAEKTKSNVSNQEPTDERKLGGFNPSH